MWRVCGLNQNSFEDSSHTGNPHDFIPPFFKFPTLGLRNRFIPWARDAIVGGGTPSLICEFFRSSTFLLTLLTATCYTRYGHWFWWSYFFPLCPDYRGSLRKFLLSCHVLDRHPLHNGRILPPRLLATCRIISCTVFLHFIKNYGDLSTSGLWFHQPAALPPPQREKRWTQSFA